MKKENNESGVKELDRVQNERPNGNIFSESDLLINGLLMTAAESDREDLGIKCGDVLIVDTTRRWEAKHFSRIVLVDDEDGTAQRIERSEPLKGKGRLPYRGTVGVVERVLREVKGT